MVDVYKTQEASIASNAKYLSVVEPYRKSEIFAFVDVSMAYSYLRVFLPTAVAPVLGEFQTLGFSWELLLTGGGLRLFGHLKDREGTSLISRHKLETHLQTTRGVSGTEEIFVCTVTINGTDVLADIFWGFLRRIRKLFVPSSNRFANRFRWGTDTLYELFQFIYDDRQKFR